MLRCGDALPRAGFQRAGSRLRMVSSLDWRFELLFCVVLPLRQHVGGQPWWAQFFQGSGHTRHQGGVEKSLAFLDLWLFGSLWNHLISLCHFTENQSIWLVFVRANKNWIEHGRLVSKQLNYKLLRRVARILIISIVRASRHASQIGLKRY